MKIFFLITLILLQTSCSTIEVAKEVTKATNSLKNSVENIVGSIEKNKEVLKVEKEREKKLAIEQKKIVKINFLEKNLDYLKIKFGNPSLDRKDGNLTVMRFDKEECRLFFFFNSDDKNKKVKHFEIRGVEGNLITKKDNIQKCYNDFNLS